LLIDALIHPKNKPDLTTSMFNKKTAIVLSVACTLQNRLDASIESQVIDIKSTFEHLSSCRDSCNSVGKQAFLPTELVDELKKICNFVKTPVVARMVLRWIFFTLNEENVYINELFHRLLLVFLHLIQDISLLHPLQRPECFSLLKTILTCSCVKGTNNNFKIASKSCIDCLVGLMATGFTILPMEFLINISPKLESSVVEHMFVCLQEAVQPPFSVDFHQSWRILQNIRATK
jgi:TH1 protein